MNGSIVTKVILPSNSKLNEYYLINSNVFIPAYNVSCGWSVEKTLVNTLSKSNLNLGNNTVFCSIVPSNNYRTPCIIYNQVITTIQIAAQNFFYLAPLQHN